ncbi:MAG: preprotein translocase subunit YajC [Bacillota bacterium]|nr:preprotein translocase subunit YajC [Thermoanaerobacteraceae bacterium]
MSSEMVSFLYIIGLFALLYFFLIRPQQVRQKKHLEMIRGLKVNDRVVTVGGIFGTIVKLKDDTAILRVADNVRIEVLKQAIAQVTRQGEEQENE